jgi:hypothetical protein
MTDERRTHTLRTYLGDRVPIPEPKPRPYSRKHLVEYAAAIHRLHTKYALACDFTQEQVHELHERVSDEWHAGVAYKALPVTTPHDRMDELDHDWRVLYAMCIGYRPGMCLYQQPDLL